MHLVAFVAEGLPPLDQLHLFLPYQVSGYRHPLAKETRYREQESEAEKKEVRGRYRTPPAQRGLTIRRINSIFRRFEEIPTLVSQVGPKQLLSRQSQQVYFYVSIYSSCRYITLWFRLASSCSKMG